MPAGSLRVTGGEARGRRLRSTRAAAMRPTTDTARKTLFDILAGRVPGARGLDLFAGAGTLGIEALSRGAEHVTFVDHDRDARAVIEANLEAIGYGERAAVRGGDALAMLAQTPPTPFDLVFIDPPYGRGLRFVARVLEALLTGGWIRPGGTVVVEAETGDLPLPAGLSEIRTRRFGRTQLTVMERDGEPHRHLPGDL